MINWLEDAAYGILDFQDSKNVTSMSKTIWRRDEEVWFLCNIKRDMFRVARQFIT